MKKSFAKLVSLILIAMLVFTMAACGSKETPAAGAEPAAEPAAEETAKEEPAAEAEAAKEEQAAAEPAKEEPAKEEAAAETSVTGTYMGQLDYTEQASKEFSESLGFEVEGPLYMDVYLDLNEDNAFYIHADAEKFKADIIDVLTSHVDDIIAKSLEQNGLTMDQLGEVAAQNGFDSEEEYKEAFAEMIEARADELIDLTEYEDDLNISGTYAVSGKTILLANEDGTDVITINDDGTLTMIVPLDGENVEVNMTKQ